jgi:hypothetical protein
MARPADGTHAVVVVVCGRVGSEGSRELESAKFNLG